MSLLRLPILIGTCLIATGAASAETGRITGTVVDSETGDALIGAFVVVKNPDGTGTAFGSATDLEGGFRIVGLPAGSYTVECSMIGYNRTTVTEVTVVADGVVALDFVLRSEAISLDEVVVQARAVRNTEAALLKERQKATAVSDAISAEDISRAGSGDAAEAMSHVTGATVQDGKYVTIRGLGDRYSTVQLNGAELPSADPNRRAVAMDMFPASMLENIVTVKSFTPDKPGNFTGGAVDLGTRRMPDGAYLAVSTSTSINTNTTLQDVLTYEGGGTGWRGADNGERNIPAAARGDIPAYAAAFGDADQAQKLDGISRSFSDVMGPHSGTAPIDYSSSVAVGNQYSLGSRPLGFLASLSSSRKHAGYDGGVNARYQLTGNVNTIDHLIDNYNLVDTRSTEEVLWGGLLNMTYLPANNHEIGATVIYNRSAEDVARYLTGRFDETLDETDTYETRVLHFTEREIRSLQITGKHHFRPLGGLQVEWSGSGSSSTQQEPDLRYFSDNYAVRGADTLYSVKASSYPDPTRYFRSLDESNREGKIDVTLPFHQWQGLPSKFRSGAFYQSKDRRFTETQYRYQRPSSVRYTGDVNAFFSDDYVGIIDASGRIPRFGNYIVDATLPSNTYDGEQQIFATYGMVDVPLHPVLRLITGLRLESTRIDVASANPLLEPGKLNTDDLLPSVNLVYQVGEANVRASYGRTLARPTFRELAPFSSFAFVGDFILTGNEQLERTLVNNYDLRWEWFPHPGEIFAVSAFYKDFTDPIERAILTTNGEVQYQNVDQATVTGVEFEARRDLAFVGSRWHNFFAGGNLALIYSNVDIPASELAIIRGFDADAATSRALQGQSPYVVNLDISYDNFETRTAAGLYYNIFGRRLSEVSLGGTPNVYEEPRSTVDFTLAKGIGTLYSLKFAARNLLDPAYRFVYPFKGTDYIAQEYHQGRSFSLSLAYKLGG
ncbi:MAG: outer membrane beta-barrel protein [bacterium]|nr:outer membrane beta-barrel protein [bacterium]